MTAKKLNISVIANNNLSQSANLQVPSDNNFKLPEKVLQFGTGVLLRGLPDYFIDKANKLGIFGGRIVVVKSTGSVAGSSDSFTAQDNLFTTCVRGIENGIQVSENIVNGAISRVLSAKDEWNTILQVASSPQVCVVISNTTEVGIQPTTEDIYNNPPDSFPAKLTACLFERFKALEGSPESGWVIIPTELIVDNGTKLKKIVLDLAKHLNLGSEFIEWVNNHNTFCNSLVDRIVPGKPEAQRLEQLEGEIGYNDDLLIMSEVYRLWAIEGNEKVAETLSFAKADTGVIIATDITEYRERKLRLLNGTHTISVALGYLYGKNTVGECMDNPLLNDFIARVAHNEIAPAVPVNAESTREFTAAVLDRFRNPFIVHPLLNITLQYTSKMSMRNVPTLFKYVAKNKKAPKLFTLGFAAYLLFMKPSEEKDGKFYGSRGGVTYPINDDSAAILASHWKNFETESGATIGKLVGDILSDTSLWGKDLTIGTANFNALVVYYLWRLTTSPANEVLAEALSKK